MEDGRNVWDEVPDWGGVGARRLARAGTLGASVWELQPGQGQFVYHFHLASEELLVVLRGSPTVRMHDGDRQLREGDVVAFPRGPEGGHQIRNESDEPARVLIVSTNADPDVAEYDSGKVGIWIGGQGRFFRVEDAVEHGGPDQRMCGDSIWGEDWPPGDDWSGGGSRSRRLPRGEDLGASVYELGPSNWVPFHFHHANEELLVVLRGRPTLRWAVFGDDP